MPSAWPGISPKLNNNSEVKLKNTSSYLDVVWRDLVQGGDDSDVGGSHEAQQE